MKIGQFEPKTTQPAATPVERKPPASQGAGGAEPSAKVELSSGATLRAEGTADGAFDRAKVDRIAAAIHEGRFQVDAGAIADKLIANAQELISRGSR